LVKNENLKIIIENEIIEIDGFGLFHSLLGDMRPGCFKTARRGGHLLLPELKTATHALENFQNLEKGYFMLDIKHIEDLSDKLNPKTFFPYGKTPLECAKIIIDAIKNPKNIESIESIIPNKNVNEKTIDIINQFNQKFRICIKNHIATFYLKV
jgi:hypothetical protein